MSYKLIEDCDQGLDVEVVELFNGSWRLVANGTIIRIRPEHRFEFVTNIGAKGYESGIYLRCGGDLFMTSPQYVEPVGLDNKKE